MARQTTLPVFPNWFPYNNMVFDGHMKVGPYEGVKTRNWEWDYRGPVLFYNSGRTALSAVKSYGYKDSPREHKIIIGTAELVEVRKLTNDEAFRMVCNFNNLSESDVKKVLRSARRKGYAVDEALFSFYNFGSYIAPYPTGFFFKNLVRFAEPVQFSWPAGPVKPINTKIVPGSSLEKQLKQVGH